jgi:ectoine hydroxylase-related dioxygenase (phytanoyl-CoA dioxygenase family)
VKTIAFSVPIFKYKVQNWSTKKKQLLDLFNNFEHKVVSSVCFIEYNKSFHKPTTFVSPFGNNITGELTRYEPDVEEGDIIFFPSNLLHYAPTNLSNLKRIIMSFNLHINHNRNKGVSYN